MDMYILLLYSGTPSLFAIDRTSCMVRFEYSNMLGGYMHVDPCVHLSSADKYREWAG